jgi:S-adenosylhomocysteine hydrolase
MGNAMEQFQVKDISLAAQGHLQVEWASLHMPVLPE